VKSAVKWCFYPGLPAGYWQRKVGLKYFAWLQMSGIILTLKIAKVTRNPIQVYWHVDRHLVIYVGKTNKMHLYLVNLF
jgi:hypothetical protein